MHKMTVSRMHERYAQTVLTFRITYVRTYIHAYIYVCMYMYKECKINYRIVCYFTLYRVSMLQELLHLYF